MSKKDAYKKGKGDTGLVSEINTSGLQARRRNLYAAGLGETPMIRNESSESREF